MILRTIITCILLTSPLSALIKTKDTDITSAVTMALNGGRLGDNLTNYWRAVYFAYQHKLPFYCPPFAYSDHLAIHKEDHTHKKNLEKYFSHIVNLKKNDRNLTLKPFNTLYKIHFEFRSDSGRGLENPNFIAFMKKRLRPLYTTKKPFRIPGRYQVALHIRRGSGPDGNFMCNQRRWPTKFPPLSFFEEALKTLDELLEHKPLQIHLFTDTKEPEALIRRLKKATQNQDIVFSYRHNNKSAHENAVIDDLMAMAHMDYFIRSASGLSQIAQYIGNHKIIIYPKDPEWVNENEVVIKKLKIIDTRN